MPPRAKPHANAIRAAVSPTSLEPPMPESVSRPHPARPAGALFAGFAVIVVLSIATDAVMHSTHIFAPEGQPMAAGLWVLALAYRCLYGVLGCNIAARLAPDRPMGHALALGGIGV